MTLLEKLDALEKQTGTRIGFASEQQTRLLIAVAKAAQEVHSQLYGHRHHGLGSMTDWDVMCSVEATLDLALEPLNAALPREAEKDELASELASAREEIAELQGFVIKVETALGTDRLPLETLFDITKWCIESCGTQKATIATMEQERDDLRAKLDTAEKDGKRLDWLERCGKHAEQFIGKRIGWTSDRYPPQVRAQQGCGTQTVREAIDAAMSAERPRK